jgi:SAM-dependent methyltransferase
MTKGYAYDHAWTEERVRLAGLEAALDPGTRAHLTRLGVGPGTRCLEVGAGGGSVAFWLAEKVAPGGTVVATDLETDFLESEATRHPRLEVLRHDIMAAALPTGFDLVHARWLVEWLPDKRLALQRMAAALRPGGVLLIEEPDFVTIYGAAEQRRFAVWSPPPCVISRRRLQLKSSMDVEFSATSPPSGFEMSKRRAAAQSSGAATPSRLTSSALRSRSCGGRSCRRDMLRRQRSTWQSPRSRIRPSPWSRR